MLWLLLSFFFKQKTAYEMRISDWSSDVCSSDLTSLLQRNNNLPANFSTSASAGIRYDSPGGAQLGLIASAGLSNEWRTRDATQQVSIDSDLGGLVRDARTVLTDNHVVVHGLLGTGEIGRAHV